MKKILAATILAASVFMFCGMMIQKTRPGVAAEFPGASLKWVHIAEGEFQRRGLNLDKYKVIVDEDEDSVAVILRGLNEPEHGRGSSGPDPGYAVEISKKDMKILSSA